MNHNTEFEAINEQITELKDLIESHADEAEEQRHLTSAVARAMARAGLYRIAAPRSLRGAEAHPITQIRSIEAISKIHGSTGWNVMIGIEVMGMLGAVYEPAITQKLYSNPELIIAGALNPLGKAVREEGGYRINGQWPFASGVHNAHYFWSQSIVHENGQPLIGEQGPVLCEHLVPEEQFDVLDTWHVSGLRGSGSHDVRVHDVFVPDAYMSQVTYQIPIESGTLFRLPNFSRLAYNKVGVATGIALAAIDQFIELANHKKPRSSGNLLRDRVDAQRAVAEAERLIGSARAYVFDVIGDLWETVERGDKPTDRQKAIVQLSCSGAANEAVKAVEMLYSAAGATANFTSCPLERSMRDVLVVRQHIMVSPQYTEAVGRVLLGMDSGTFLF
ncbi:MAG: acyl-CoA dehydrogenase family protein [Gammaproteobacteria bacterium]|nr:acyl-CoA dehydrogenase family protein [Gammaproteobacteria bacterium]